MISAQSCLRRFHFACGVSHSNRAGQNPNHPKRNRHGGQLTPLSARGPPPEAMPARLPATVREIHPCEFPTCSCAEIVADHILFVPGEECGRCFECLKAVRSKEWDPHDLRWNVLAVKIVARQRNAPDSIRNALEEITKGMGAKCHTTTK